MDKEVEKIENIYAISCRGKNTGCEHEDNPNINQCLDCGYVRVKDIKPSKDYNFSPIREADSVKPSTAREITSEEAGELLVCFVDEYVRNYGKYSKRARNSNIYKKLKAISQATIERGK